MNQSEYKIRNLESSILYIQQEYANTLKLLHDEIKDLQMKNSELSFHFAMDNIGISKDSTNSDVQKDNSDLLNQIKVLKENVAHLKFENDSKTKQLANFETSVRLLQANIDKLKESQKDQLTAVELELNSKSAEIVMLSTKLHNWKKLDMSKPNDRDNKKFVVPDISLPTKIFKFRNQISVHPDDNNVKRRPIIARHTLISTSHPVRSKTVSPNQECALSVEEISNFSKSIKRTTILPPINSTKNLSIDDKSEYPFYQTSTIGITKYNRDIGVDLFHNSCESKKYDFLINRTADGDENNITTVDISTNYNSNQLEPSIIKVNIDEIMDMNNSSGLLTSKKQVNYMVERNHSS